MQSLRKEDLSLSHHIKHTALRDFIEKEEQVPLQLMSNMSCTGTYVYEAITSTLPSPTDRGRGWVYFDCPQYDEYGDCIYSLPTCNPEFVMVSGTDAHGASCIGTPEQSERVIVYDSNLQTISGVPYVIDYLDGRVVLATNSVIPKYVDYYWNYVSVVDEWAAIEASDPPVVVIDMFGTDKDGYQFGGGKKVNRKVDIHVFASNTSERNDLVEAIHDSLYNKSAPIYEFPTGDVLDFDGTFYGRKDNPNKLTSLFNRTTLNNTSVTHGGMMFQKVSSRHVNLPLVMSLSRNEVMLSDLNAYRSRISFEVEIYTRK
jgi:hypothetical protein